MASHSLSTFQLEYAVEQEHWQRDETSPCCSTCAKAFNLLTRRHHCRACGSVVCDRCSSSKLSLPNSLIPERVCIVCYELRASLDSFRSKYVPTLQSWGPNTYQKVADASWIRYEPKLEPYPCQLWLGKTLTVLLWTNQQGQANGELVTNIKTILGGHRSPEFQSRLKKTVMCCMTKSDDQLARAQSECLTIVFYDGSVMDVRAPSEQAADEFTRGMLAAKETVGPYLRYHLDKKGPWTAEKLIRSECSALQETTESLAQSLARAEGKRVREERAASLRAKYGHLASSSSSSSGGSRGSIKGNPLVSPVMGDARKPLLDATSSRS